MVTWSSWVLRNDAEPFNSQLKRTLLVDRAMSLGGRRQLLDVLCFAHLHNATNALRAGALPAVGTRQLRRLALRNRHLREWCASP